MANTDLTICNAAVIPLGERPFSAFNETSAGRICENAYSLLRDSILGTDSWNFCKAKKELTRDSAAPPAHWNYSFQLPPDRLSRPFKLYPSGDVGAPVLDQFRLFGNRVYANETRVWCDYSQIKDEAEWPAYFVRFMILAVRAEVAYAITDQQNVADHWHQIAYGTPQEEGRGGAFNAALTTDAQSEPNGGIEETEYDLIAARYS